MTRKKKAPTALCTRAEHALLLNRKARLNFPGIFIGLGGRKLGPEDLVLEIPEDPVLYDARGELNLLALGVVVDIALGAVTRLQTEPTVRPATVQLAMQMTGAPMTGAISTHAHYVGRCERLGLTQMLSTGVIKSGDTLIGHASGAFVMLDLPEGTTQTPWPWVPAEIAEAPAEAYELDDAERAAVKACARAEAAATVEQPFIEHFWCGIPKRGAGSAQLSVNVTPHLGNRVGHVHGGISLGMAARVACAAAPDTMRLSNLTAWFVSPGLPPRLRIRSRVVQQGRNLAVVHTQIVGATGKLVLEVTSQHVAGA
jgi:acyl-coenzyme A thioesterase PaaI-like protein